MTVPPTELHYPSGLELLERVVPMGVVNSSDGPVSVPGVISFELAHFFGVLAFLFTPSISSKPSDLPVAKTVSTGFFIN